jgi:energy-coupling factor transporter ATP-binding protein EcfA2
MKIPLPSERRNPTQIITVTGARENNLKNLNVNFPLGVFTAITGVSGSGKSSLVIEILYKALSSLVMKSKEYPGAFDEITGVEAIDKVIDIISHPSDVHQDQTLQLIQGFLLQSVNSLLNSLSQKSEDTRQDVFHLMLPVAAANHAKGME